MRGPQHEEHGSTWTADGNARGSRGEMAIAMLHDRFVIRDDRWAEQRQDGRYRRVDERLTEAALRDHLLGRRVVGVYQLDDQDQVLWTAVDLDLVDPSAPIAEHHDRFKALVERILAAARSLGLDGLVEFSGRRGYHVWFLFERPVPAAAARKCGQQIVEAAALPAAGPIKAEVFPKQDALTDAAPVGNLVKLPWAKHRLGNRSCFVDRNLKMIEPWFTGQYESLADTPLNTAETLARFRADEDADTPSPAPDASAPPDRHRPIDWREVLRLVQRHHRIRDLFRGEPAVVNHYASRSEAEFALAVRLFSGGLSRDQVDDVLHAAAIGKWADGGKHYRRRTLTKALQASDATHGSTEEKIHPTEERRP